MHITLLLLGFLVEEPKEEAEVSRKRLEELVASARIALSSFPALTVGLANLNAFPGAAFVEVHDDGMLDRLREVLCASCGLERPSGPPHLTLAYFQAPDGTPAPEGLISAIARYRAWDVGRLGIQNVEATVLDLSLDYPEPEVLARMPLGGGIRL
jgi:2'-5' RNA ligase